MTKKIALIAILISTIFACNNSTKLTYKYTEKDDPFKCANQDMKLVKEALYVFEDYILKNYDFKNRGLVLSSYDSFLLNSGHNFIPMAERIDEHMKTVFYTLREQENLWKTVDDQVLLDYNSNLVQCIVENVQDDQIRKVLDALLQTKTLKASTVAPILKRNAAQLQKDKALASFVALELFYAKLVDLDLSLSPEELSAQIREINNQRAGHVHK